MNDPELTNCLTAQGCVLVRTIEALSTIEPSGPFEWALTRLLQAMPWMSKD